MIQRDSRDNEVKKFKGWLKNNDKKHTEMYLSERVAKRNIQKAHSRERMSPNALSLAHTYIHVHKLKRASKARKNKNPGENWFDKNKQNITLHKSNHLFILASNQSEKPELNNITRK